MEDLKNMKKNTIISTIAGVVTGAVTSSILVYKKQKKVIDRKTEYQAKMKEFYELLVAWLALKQENKSLSDYFIKNNYKTVAIYGMKELGERLLNELQGSEIEIKYIIDRNADGIYADLDVFTPDDELEDVDVVVVTAIHYFDEIEAEMSDKMSCPIISLEDVIYAV